MRKPGRVGARQHGLVDQGAGEVLAAQHRHQSGAVLVVGRLDEVVHDPGHPLPFGGGSGGPPALAPGRLRVAEPLPGRVTAVSTSYNILARLFGGGLGSQIGIIILIAHRVPGAGGLSRESAFPTAFAIASAIALGGAFLASLTRVNTEPS